MPTLYRYVGEQRARPGSVAWRISALHSLYRWLKEEGYRPDDPAEGLRTPKRHRPPPEPFTKNDLRDMLAACLTLRDRTLLLFLLGSACRRSEVAGMRPADIDWQRGRVLVRGKGGKHRYVAPGRAAMAALLAYLELRRHCGVGRRKGGDRYVWLTRDATPLSGMRIYEAVRRIAERAGVHNAKPHRFRVSAANGLLKVGMALDELQEVLGHADIKTTAYYASWTRRERAVERQGALSLADRL